MKSLRNVMVLVGMMYAAFSPCAHGEATAAQRQGAMICSPAAQDLRMAMRLLWEEHVSYTRNVVTSMLSDLPDKEIATARLLQNQTDLGNAIKPFYGVAAGDRLAALLKDHIVIAAAVVTAARSGNQADLAASQKKWVANAKALAAFLASANPHWRESELEQMLQGHLDLLTRQVVARLHGDWSADIRAYDEGLKHMMMLADVLTRGLVAQFPDRF